MLNEDHPLLKEARVNLKNSIQRIGRPTPGWVLPEDLEHDSSQKLYPEQRYDYATYFWCERLVGVFERLEETVDMTSRNLYKRRDEDKSTLLKEWTLHNYEFYTLLYQSIRDISLLLTSEVFDLGISYRVCSLQTVCSNRRVKGTQVGRILKQIDRISSIHREGKNFLLHRGQRVELPLKRRQLRTEDVSSIALKLGTEVGYTRRLLEEFFAIHDRKQLIPMMKKECLKLEQRVQQLFDALLPYYRKIRQLYSLVPLA